ncbi:hypothetical protein JCM10213_005565 [Rhodosporidiobolus nylandii]
MSGYCASCNLSNTLEYAPELGTLACTVCGTVSADSSSHTFEFLARVDEEDSFQGGRTYVAGGAGGGYQAFGGAAGAAMGGQAARWASKAGEGKAVYHSRKRNDLETYIRRLLSRFQLYDSLRERVRFLFDDAKKKIDFKWGRAAEIFAAACVYIAAREANKNLWLLELAEVIEVKDIYTLTRAIRIVKFECQTDPKEIDPALFLERILAHLNTLFASSPTPPLHGSSVKSKKTWSASSLTWVRSLSLPEVRSLATGLLSFADGVSLIAGRAPEQVACAVILVAMEGVARRPAPILQEFADELAWAMGVKAFTIQERYREFIKLLADYAPQLPWLAHEEFAVPGEKAKKGRSRSSKKKELVQYTSDIVQFRRAIDARKAKERGEKAAAEEKERESAEAEEAASERRSTRSSTRAKSKGKGKGKAVEPDEDDVSGVGSEDEEEDPAGEDFFTDPLRDLAASSAFLRDPDPPRLPSHDPVPSQPPPTQQAVPLARATKARVPLKGGVKRPAEYIRGGDKPQKRMKRIEDVAGGLFSTLPSASGTPIGLSPPPGDSPRLAASCSPPAEDPPPAFRLSHRIHSGEGAVKAFSRPAHDPENVQIRQLLLAGHNPQTIYAHLHNPNTLEARAVVSPAMRSATRLGKLLWDKPVDDISDAELFDDGELDSYVRSKPEVETFLRLPKTQDMLQQAMEVEARNAVRPPRRPGYSKRNKFFAKYYPRWDDPADAPPPRPPRANAAGGRKDREGTDGSDSFAPRKKSTKLKEGAQARIEALFALDDDDGGFGGAPSSSFTGREGGFSAQGTRDDWQFDLALDAAEDEGEDVVDDEDDGEEAASAHRRPAAADEDEDDDWRKTLGYTQQGGDDEEYYDD